VTGRSLLGKVVVYNIAYACAAKREVEKPAPRLFSPGADFKLTFLYFSLEANQV
jgi:hypothetical protein